MIFMDSEKREIKNKDQASTVNKNNKGVTNEEQISLLAGLFQDNNDVKKK